MNVIELSHPWSCSLDIKDETHPAAKVCSSQITSMSNGKSSWQESPSSMGDRVKRTQQKGLCWPSSQALSPPNLCRSIADSTNRAVRSRKRHHTRRTQLGRVGVDTDHYSLGASRQHGDLSRYHRAVQTGPGARPEITNHSWHITRKYGFAVNAEQSLTRYLTAFGRFGCCLPQGSLPGANRCI
jgi:hypothetical protein